MQFRDSEEEMSTAIPQTVIEPRTARQPRIGQWMAWSAWSECQGECGHDFQTRVRKCLGGLPGETCAGKRHDIRGCQIPRRKACSYWSGWSEWNEPTQTCGDSKRCKTRTCIGHKAGFEKCVGEPRVIQMTACNASGQKSSWFNRL